MNKTCYLCGKIILESDSKNKDHVFPKQFIKREHPKSKGFDYLGILPTHQKCNSQFGDSKSDSESMVKKSLKLINVLFDPDSHIIREHKENPNLKILGINSDFLTGFSSKDLKFFQISDVRNIDYKILSSVEFLNNQKSVKPFDKSSNVCLSVLAKSAVAILIKKESIDIPSNWIIVAYPGFIQNIEIDFDSLLGDTKPLEVGIKFWSKRIDRENYICVFKFKSIVIFFHYAFDSGLHLREVLPKLFKDENIVVFRGNSLLDLIGYEWSNNFLEL